MNVLILGSGGREHAIAWKVHQSPMLKKLFVAPGNAGTKAIAENAPLKLDDFSSIKDFVLNHHVDLVIVGPEQPLVDGITDYFHAENQLQGVRILGPEAAAAKLEGSKHFAKQFMQRHNIPTAASRSFTVDNLSEGLKFLENIKSPYVLKADGLAAGKGVLIHDNLSEAQQALTDMLEGHKFGDASKCVVIEEFLDGMECSAFAITDGRNYQLLPVAKDYKRIGEGDTGLNTGGMGCVSPVSFVDKGFMEKVDKKIVKPTIDGLVAEGFDYKGFLFFGLMKVDDEPFVIEYNVRLGDPETQVILPRIEGDFLKLCYQAADGSLEKQPIVFSDNMALAVIAASGGYPEAYEKGMKISGLEALEQAIVFHAGTKIHNNEFLTAGGRVLAVVALEQDIENLRKIAYDSMKMIQFEKKYFRSDIGLDLIS